MFPQYDIVDLILPKTAQPKDLKELYDTTEERILICRTSILSVLTSDIWKEQWEEKQVEYDECLEKKLEQFRDKSLRRMGLGARLKAELFEVASELGSKLLTFNIGKLKEPSGGIKMVNMPSTEHNKWTGFISWKDYPSEIGAEATMFWYVYGAEIQHGIEEFWRPYGLLSGKGWLKKYVEESAQKKLLQIRADIEEGRHAPW